MFFFLFDQQLTQNVALFVFFPPVFYQLVSSLYSPLLFLVFSCDSLSSYTFSISFSLSLIHSLILSSSSYFSPILPCCFPPSSPVISYFCVFSSTKTNACFSLNLSSSLVLLSFHFLFVPFISSSPSSLFTFASPPSGCHGNRQFDLTTNVMMDENRP